MAFAYSHVIGFDDAPFAPDHRGKVMVIGAAFAGLRLEGVLRGYVRRDGADSTHVLIELVSRSRFFPQLRLILLQGIALAGFNVVDLHGLHRALRVPAVAVVRRRPNLERVRQALLIRVRGGARKWKLIERLDPAEPMRELYVQRAGISTEDTYAVLRRLALNGHMPEPLRTAHLIAGGVALGESRHRA
jgi:hypothetical protein